MNDWNQKHIIFLERITKMILASDFDFAMDKQIVVDFVCFLSV